MQRDKILRPDLLRISVAYQLMQRDKISPSKEGNEEMTS
jgi:hypothetical protein